MKRKESESNEKCNCGEQCDCGEACSCGDDCSCKEQAGRGKNCKKCAEYEQKITELTNDLQRTRADFENYRKQVEVQRDAAVKTAQLATVYKVLPLLDDIDRAFGAYDELAPLKKDLEKTLNELKLKKIPSEVGTEFNPDLHDAIMVEGDGVTETVAETLRPGYFYESEVLRPAMVKVTKK